MEDARIYEIAIDVLTDITKDLNEITYSDLNGTLTLVWSAQQSFNAWARSEANIGLPPKHKISLNYELVRQIYRDVESFCEFSEAELGCEGAQKFFLGLDPEPTLPEGYTKEQCCLNMFLGALTFVYFHEHAHLMQEHGYIRNKFNESTGTTINEFNVNSQAPITGREAALSHVTELAADYHAVTQCISEIVRQFDGEKLKFRGAIYIFVCGLSCIFHKFNNDLSNVSIEEPVGSHPHPTNRMEVNLPHIFELLDQLDGHIKPKFSRKELVHLCHTASISSALFEMRRRAPGKTIEGNLFLKGALNKPEEINYLRKIVSTWDEIEPSISEVTHTKHPFFLLGFSDEFRKHLE